MYHLQEDVHHAIIRRNNLYDLFNKNREKPQAAIEKRLAGHDKNVSSSYILSSKIKDNLKFLNIFLSPPHFPPNKYYFHNF